MTDPRRLAAGTLAVCAALGPVGGVAALALGEVALWGDPLPGPVDDVACAGLWLGTWPTLMGIGFLLAAPFRLLAALGLASRARWAWPAAAVAGIAGLADLSVGPILAIGLILLWRQESSSAPKLPGTTEAGPMALEAGPVDSHGDRGSGIA